MINLPGSQEQQRQCAVCQCYFSIEALECPDCLKRYPASLLKACSDPFDYAARLRTGEVIRFHEASIHGEFVRLSGVDAESDHRIDGLLFSCPRGVDVRITDIVWCADAPEGS